MVQNDYSMCTEALDPVFPIVVARFNIRISKVWPHCPCYISQGIPVHLNKRRGSTDQFFASRTSATSIFPKRWWFTLTFKLHVLRE